MLISHTAVDVGTPPTSLMLPAESCIDNKDNFIGQLPAENIQHPVDQGMLSYIDSSRQGYGYGANT